MRISDCSSDVCSSDLVAGPDQHAERRNARQHLFLLIFGRWRFGFLDARALWRELRPAQPQQCAIRERTFDAHTAEYRLGRTALLSLQELPAEREIGAVAQDRKSQRLNSSHECET